MNAGLASGVVSITSTRRRRFLWCAWLGGAPTRETFRAPDHFTTGGALSPEDAHIEAERACGVALRLVEPQWARAWMRMQRGEPAFYARREPSISRAPRALDAHDEALAILGLARGATRPEVRRAFKEKAAATHPDRGGTEVAFVAVVRAYERLR